LIGSDGKTMRVCRVTPAPAPLVSSSDWSSTFHAWCTRHGVRALNVIGGGSHFLYFARGAGLVKFGISARPHKRCLQFSGLHCSLAVVIEGGGYCAEGCALDAMRRFSVGGISWFRDEGPIAELVAELVKAAGSRVLAEAA
jgi:hypothetical protein